MERVDRDVRGVVVDVDDLGKARVGGVMSMRAGERAHLHVMRSFA